MLAFFIAVMIVIAFLMPFIVIWSINTLFGLGIAYTFSTYVATLILTNILSGIANAAITTAKKEI